MKIILMMIIEYDDNNDNSDNDGDNIDNNNNNSDNGENNDNNDKQQSSFQWFEAPCPSRNVTVMWYIYATPSYCWKQL